VKNKIVLFVLSFIVWMLLGWPFDWQHAALGIFVSGFVIFLTADLFHAGARHFFHIRRYYWFIFYVIFMTWQCIKANIDMALAALNPAYSPSPGIIKVKTGLKSSMALAFLANSISLSRGALSVDVAPKIGILYVHQINIKNHDTVEAVQKLTEKYESILKRIFE